MSLNRIRNDRMETMVLKLRIVYNSYGLSRTKIYKKKCMKIYEIYFCEQERMDEKIVKRDPEEARMLYDGEINFSEE